MNLIHKILKLISLFLLSVMLLPEVKLNAQESVRTIEIDELIVRGGRIKYRNRGNPAVELIDSVLAYKDLNRSTNFNSLRYQKYEKIVFSFTNIGERVKTMKLLNKFSFVFDNIDTIRSPGREVLPIYIRERLSDYTYHGESGTSNEIIRGERMVTFEEHMDDRVSESG